MKVIQYVHGESSFTVYVEPLVENLELLDKFFLENDGYAPLQDAEGYEANIGLFVTIPATNDWGTIYVAKSWIILTLNKLHPKFEKIKSELFP